MDTKILMMASAFVMGVFGLGATFFPQEIVHVAGTPTNEWAVVVVQLLGALYLGFAMMNWMAKTVLIGGIYARPLAMGNFLHFMAGGLSLLKVAMHNPSLTYSWPAAILYAVFAILFGLIVFTNPKKVKSSVES